MGTSAAIADPSRKLMRTYPETLGWAAPQRRQLLVVRFAPGADLTALWYQST